MRASNLCKLKDILSHTKHSNILRKEIELILIDEINYSFPAKIENKEDIIHTLVKELSPRDYNEQIAKIYHKGETARMRWISKLSDSWRGNRLMSIWGWVLYIFSPIVIIFYKIFGNDHQSDQENFDSCIRQLGDTLDNFVVRSVDLLKQLQSIQDSITKTNELKIDDLKRNIKNLTATNNKYDLNDRRIMRMIQNSFRAIQKITEQNPEMYNIYKDWISNYVSMSKYEFMEYTEQESERFEVSIQPVDCITMIYPAIVSKEDKSTIEYGAVAIPFKED